MKLTQAHLLNKMSDILLVPAEMVSQMTSIQFYAMSTSYGLPVAMSANVQGFAHVSPDEVVVFLSIRQLSIVRDALSSKTDISFKDASGHTFRVLDSDENLRVAEEDNQSYFGCPAGTTSGGSVVEYASDCKCGKGQKGNAITGCSGRMLEEVQNRTTNPGVYSVLWSDKYGCIEGDAKQNMLKTYSSVGLSKCKEYCDANLECVAIVKTRYACKLMSADSVCTPRDKEGWGSLYIRSETAMPTMTPTSNPTTSIPLKILLKILLKIPLRIPLRILLKIPLRILLRILLRIPLRILLRIPRLVQRLPTQPKIPRLVQRLPTQLKIPQLVQRLPIPTENPTASTKTSNPTENPTAATTSNPTENPTAAATTSNPTENPTAAATTSNPTDNPTVGETTLEPTTSKPATDPPTAPKVCAGDDGFPGKFSDLLNCNDAFVYRTLYGIECSTPFSEAAKTRPELESVPGSFCDYCCASCNFIGSACPGGVSVVETDTPTFANIEIPTKKPTKPAPVTDAPTVLPPTAAATKRPTERDRTKAPTHQSTSEPTKEPTKMPTKNPTVIVEGNSFRKQCLPDPVSLSEAETLCSLLESHIAPQKSSSRTQL